MVPYQWPDKCQEAFLGKTCSLAFFLLGVLLAGCGGAGLGTGSGGGNPPPAAYSVVGYFPQWGIYATHPYYVNNTLTSGSAPLMTHIIYAFGGIVNNQCATADANADYLTLIPANQAVNGTADTPGSFAGNFHQLQELKQKYPALQIEISIGGGAFNPALFSAAASPANVQAFVASCINMYIKGNFATGISQPGIFTGFDIDWECPSSPADETNMAAMLAEFRRQLDQIQPGYQLTIDASAGSWCWNYYNFSAMTPSLDFYNLMAYDFDGPWSNTTGFVAPLYQASLDPDPNNNANYAVDFYIAQGVPASKIVMGMPFYNYGWTAVPATGDGLFQPGVAVHDNGGYSMTEALVHTPGYALYRDATTQEPWLYDSASGSFWTFDDPDSLAFKSRYVKAKNLGGIMFWELSSDDANATLLKSMANALQ